MNSNTNTVLKINPPTKPKTKRIKIDWEALSREYRAGIRSLRDIGQEYGVTEGAIRKKAKLEEWPRDLSERILARAEELLVRKEVRKEVFSTQESSVVEDNAQETYLVLSGHRLSALKLHEQADKFMLELAIYEDDLAKRTRILKDLTDVRKSIVDMDRRNFGLDKGIDKSQSIGEFLESIA